MARLFRVLAWIALILAIFVVLPVTFLFKIVGTHDDLIWNLFYNSPLIGAGLGVCIGFIGSSWYRDARLIESPNLVIRGAFLGVFATIVLLAGLSQTYDFLGSLNKVSTSVISIEFDPTRKKESSKLTANAASGGNNLDGSKWTVTERIGVAISVLADLADKGLNLDERAAEFGANGVVIYPDTSSQDPQMQEIRKFMESNEILSLVVIRRGLHDIKRNANPIYFDSVDQDEVRLVTRLRDIVLSDFNGHRIAKEYRDSKIAALADVFSDFKVRSLELDCILLVWPRTDETCEKLQRKDGPAEHAKELAERFRQAFPPPEAVRETPYIAIIAASLFYAGGESEAAVSILDRWLASRESAATSALGTTSTWTNRDIFRDYLARLHTIRVLNMMGYFFANDASPIHLELGTKYQWAALRESNDLILRTPALSEYVKMRTLTSPGFDLLSLVATPPSDQRWHCQPATGGTPASRYVVFRKWSLLNNVVFYLAKQPRLIERAELVDQFDNLIAELRSLRADCLGRDVRSDLEASSSERKRQFASADTMGRTLDTLARAFITRAVLRKGNDRATKVALCDALRAAQASKSWAKRSDELLDLLQAEADSKSPSTSGRQEKGFSHKRFVAAGLSENGERIVRRQPIDEADSLVQETKESIEKLGQGACVGQSDGL